MTKIPNHTPKYNHLSFQTEKRGYSKWTWVKQTFVWEKSRTNLYTLSYTYAFMFILNSSKTESNMKDKNDYLKSVNMFRILHRPFNIKGYKSCIWGKLVTMATPSFKVPGAEAVTWGQEWDKLLRNLCREWVLYHPGLAREIGIVF